VVLAGLEQGEEQCPAPIPGVGLVHRAGQAEVDHRRSVVVHRGKEEGLFVGEIGVGDGPAHRGIPSDVGHRGGAVPLPSESGHCGIEDGPAGLGPLGQGEVLIGVERHQHHGSKK
jgi:hypothetical protein